MFKDQKAKGKKEERKSGGLDSVLLGVTELGEECAKVMANKRDTKQKRELYPCWVCSNNVSSGSSIGCDDCDAWAHAKCVNHTDTFIEQINKGNKIKINAQCRPCMSKKKSERSDEGNKEIKTDHGNSKG